MILCSSSPSLARLSAFSLPGAVKPLIPSFNSGGSSMVAMIPQQACAKRDFTSPTPKPDPVDSRQLNTLADVSIRLLPLHVTNNMLMVSAPDIVYHLKIDNHT